MRNHRALFLSQLEQVTLIDPAKTALVFDDSPMFIAARLAIESRLRQSAVQDGAVVQGHGLTPSSRAATYPGSACNCAAATRW